MITVSLVDMPSRVGASLLHAIGCPELIAPDTNSYVEMAVALAVGPAIDSEEEVLPLHIKSRFGSTALKNLRAKIETNRLEKPLFNTRKKVSDLENAFRQIIWNY